MKTVSQVAQVSGVTVRTLHHYDEIGLLVPSARTAAGYRLYDRADLQRLQEILFWRELGFGLPEIRSIVTDPGHDRGAALREQLVALKERAESLATVQSAVESALKAHEEEITVDDEDLFGGFDPSQYEDEARERWGGTPAYEESQRRVSRYGKAEWQQIKAESTRINDDFVALLEAGTPASSPEAAAVAEAHREHISRWFYACSPEIHVGLGRMYVGDPRFTATYEAIQAGLALYVRDAILACAGVDAG